MKVDLSNIISSYEYQYSLLNLSRDGSYIEFRDDNHIQYLLNLSNGNISKRNYYDDYIFLNHGIGNNFIKLREGNLYIPERDSEGQYSRLFKSSINDIYYIRGVIFSEIDFDSNRLILASRCPNSLKNQNNDFFINDFLYKNSDSFHWYKRPQKDEIIENEIIISIFDLNGALIKSFFLQNCDANSYDTKCDCSLARKEILLYSSEHTFRINYLTGNIEGVYEGESCNFINDNLLGHWQWFGYDSFFDGDLILDNSNDVIAEIDLSQFNIKESEYFFIDKTVTIGDYIYFISNYPHEIGYQKRRIFKIQINNWNQHKCTGLILNDNERLLSCHNNNIYAYSIEDKILQVNIIDLECLTFDNPKTTNIKSKTKPQAIERFYFIDLHTKSSKAIGENKFITERTKVGELLYRFKYCFDNKVLDELHSHILNFLNNEKINFDVIIPVPPSNLNRQFQPVYELANKLLESDFNVDFDFLIKTESTPPIKEINDSITRKELLKNIFDVKDLRYKNKTILLFDDLFRSGETLNNIAKAIKVKGLVKDVFAFTITKTRTKK